MFICVCVCACASFASDSYENYIEQEYIGITNAALIIDLTFVLAFPRCSAFRSSTPFAFFIRLLYVFLLITGDRSVSCRIICCDRGWKAEIHIWKMKCLVKHDEKGVMDEVGISRGISITWKKIIFLSRHRFMRACTVHTIRTIRTSLQLRRCKLGNWFNRKRARGLAKFVYLAYRRCNPGVMFY